MPNPKTTMGPIWAVVIAGAVLLVMVQFLPDKESAQKLAHFFIAIALIVALLMGFKDFRKNKGEE
jgi:amino acid permease